jgi:hypothetical protein
MKPLADYIRKNKNKFPVSVIWGSGNSVNSLSPGAHAPYLNFAVNASILLFPFWKTGNANNRIFMAIDKDAFGWTWFQNGMRSHCCKLFRRYAFDRAKTNRPYFPPNVYKYPKTWYFDMRQEDEPVVDISKLSTVPYASVIPMAIDISMKLGVKLIALTGVEHSPKDGMTHFWEEWHSYKRPVHTSKEGKSRKPKDISNQRRVWNSNTSVFKKLHKASKKYGVEIVRLTENSTLDFIPYMTEADFLKKAKKAN